MNNLPTLTLPATDEAREVWAEVYERDCYGFRELAAQGFKPETVWDVGASWGPASLLAGELWPDARIYAFEPRSDRAGMAHSNTKHLGTVHVWPVGLIGFWGEPGWPAWDGIAFDGVWRKSPLEVLRDPDLMSRYVSVSDFWRTIPTPLPRRIDLLKIDCEGAELGILAEMATYGIRMGEIRGEWHFDAYSGIPHLLRTSHRCRMDPAEVGAGPWNYFRATPYGPSERCPVGWRDQEGV